MRKRPIKLNLGCGFKRIPGYINVDSVQEWSPDEVVNLEQFPWPWADNSVDEVQLIHVLEYLGRKSEVFIRIMQELYRVCTNNANIHVLVSHHRHDNFKSDPTRVRPITPLGLSLFDREKCVSWIVSGLSNTPLALNYNVDFETCSIEYDYEELWLKKVESGQITPMQLSEAALHQCNVITQIRYLLNVRKHVGSGVTKESNVLKKYV
jgi:hypothetical protein